MSKGKLLMISTDRLIFEPNSDVFRRQAEYAREWEEVHIIVFEKQGERSRKQGEVTIAPNCWAYSTKSNSKVFYAFDAIRLGRFICTERHITNITCQDASLTAMAGLSLKKQFHIPVEIQVHEDLASPKYAYNVINRIRRAMALSNLPKADHIRVVSERLRTFMIETLHIPAERVELRPIAVDAQWIKGSPMVLDLHKRYPQFDKIVLMASRLEREKNIMLALRAWPLILVKHPGAGLVIVGKGSYDQVFRRYLEHHALNHSVILEKWATRIELAAHYKSADVFLNTSLFEGYGMTLKEAQAAGLPIISTDVGIAREVGATIVDWNEKAVASAVISALG